MLLVELPLFAKTGLGVDMEVITLMASLPFLANWVWCLVYSRVLDQLMGRGRLTPLSARRLSVFVSSALPGLCLIAIIIAGEDVLGVVIFTTLAVMFYGSMFSGIFTTIFVRSSLEGRQQVVLDEKIGMWERQKVILDGKIGLYGRRKVVLDGKIGL